MRGSTRALAKAQIARVRQRLRELSLELGSETKAARDIGVSQQVVNRIVKGDAAGLYVAERLAEYDKVPLEAILHGIPESLHKVLRANQGRWERWTIAAVCKEYGTGDGDPQQWEHILDQVERALAPILGRNQGTKKR